MELLSPYNFNLEYLKASGHENFNFLSRLYVEATEWNMKDDERLIHADGVDVYFVGASELWSIVAPPGSANSRILIPNMTTTVRRF